MEQWLQITLSVAGAVGGGYMGVKVALARLETQMSFVLQEIARLRENQHEHASAIADLKARVYMWDHSK